VRGVRYSQSRGWRGSGPANFIIARCIAPCTRIFGRRRPPRCRIVGCYSYFGAAGAVVVLSDFGYGFRCAGKLRVYYRYPGPGQGPAGKGAGAATGSARPSHTAKPASIGPLWRPAVTRGKVVPAGVEGATRVV